MNFNGYETEKCFLSLVAAVLNGETVPPVPGNVSVDDLIKTGSAHNMAPILFCALNLLKDAKIGEKTAELKKNFLSDCMRSSIQMDEYGKLVTYLCGKGVKIIPLKGCVIKELYPSPFMRVMSDVDLLYEGVTTEELSEIMTEFGYSTEVLEKGNHDVFYKKPCMNIELHRKLMDDNSPAKAILSNMFEKAVHDKDIQNLYHMRNEDFYIHFVAHSAKHFQNAGLGIRPVVDFYVLDRKFGVSWDKAYIEKQLSSAGLLDYEKKMKGIAKTFFGNGNAEVTEKEFAFFFRGGTYGKADTKWKYMSDGGISRLEFLRKRIFLPYAQMCSIYPSKKNKPVLLPFMWFRRGVDVLIHRRGNLKKVIYDSKSISEESAAYAADIMKTFGLTQKQ